MTIAIVHSVSPHIHHCRLSFLNRQPIDYNLAVQQHRAYCQALRDCGISLIELSTNEYYPDAVFVEDTAVVVDEVALICRMGAESRRGEEEAIYKELKKYRKIIRMRAPATLEGGDVLRIGRKVFVGQSARSNPAGHQFLKDALVPYGYQIIPVAVRGCLHLKSACTALDESTILANPDWVDLKPFEGYSVVPVADEEPHAANVLRLDDRVFMIANFPKTVNVVKSLRYRVNTIDISELLKAEAGLTCSSIILSID